jgi:hypothetical protein
MATIARYVVGADLGRKTNRTAVAVLEWRREAGERNPVDNSHAVNESYRGTHVQRMAPGVLYLDAAARVGQSVSWLKRRGDERVNMVVDETGLGRPVLEA